nr:septum formation initiator family protein [Streptomyces sp. SID10362]
MRGRAARLVRLLPTGGTRGQAARAPFVLLVVVLLGGGLIGLLVLNSALSEGSFQLDDLKQRTKELTDEEQALQRDIDAYSAPRALQRRARELGMVPGGDPAFLDPDGSVKGSPSPAPAAATPLVLAPEALTATSGSPSAPTPSAYAEPSAPAPTSTTAGTSATPTPAATPTPTPTPGR